MPATSALHDYFTDLQTRLVAAAEALEGPTGGRFRRDPWQRPASETSTGNGLTCIIEEGQVFERGGVAFSQVRGPALPPAATAKRPELVGRSFEAMGVSLVLHPTNPYCPTAHLNVRCLIAHPARPEEAPIWWFGGGMDLTPYYPQDEDIRHFHGQCKAALSPFGEELYPRFKHACDRYFYLPHRNEARGVGGIFFDDLCEGGFERCFALTQAVGNAFADAYLPLVARHQTQPYGARERDFQAYRRGRYVEFNLVCDRGTLFGLQSGGRTESILMSLPPIAHWRYDWQATPGSPEAQLDEFLKPRDWA